MPIQSLDQLRRAMAEAGVRQIFVKRLAVNDNSKQQIYLGGDFSALNVLPHGAIIPDTAPKTPNFKAGLRLFWLDAQGQKHRAPGAQLILYPDYPEVRMSGFLKGCAGAPSALLTGRAPGRLLFLGVAENTESENEAGEILAFAASAQSAIAGEFEVLLDLATNGVFSILPALLAPAPNTRTAMLQALGEIHRRGWIASSRLRADGVLIPYTAQNGGGYTLEAALGITPNGVSQPDFLGWEVKQYGVSDLQFPERGKAITLMTPEPDGGVYHDDFFGFMRFYGYPDSTQPDRLNFGGVHQVGVTHPRTRLCLQLRGFDAPSGKLTDVNGGLHLVDPNGNSAASWAFAGLLAHWSRKHNQAVYVPSQKQNGGATLAYRYGSTVKLGEQTDPLLFLTALAGALVYYDPAPKIEGVSTPHPVSKKRNQFRVKLPHLAPLYHHFSLESVL